MATATEELLFRVRGDTAQAKSAFKDLKNSSTSDIKDIETGLTDVGTAGSAALESLVNPAALAVSGITALSSAALVAAKVLYNLTVSAAEYGSEIFDASQKTGLHAQTLTAMDFAAKQSGTSLDAVTTATAKFAKTVGDAADGTKKATADLKAFGLEPQEAMNDLDGALAKVFKTIVEARSGVEQMSLAQKAFGRSGADLLPFIKSFDGDLVALTEKAKDLGLTLDDETVAAADNLGDAMDQASQQVHMAGIQLGSIFMPILADFFTNLSTWLAENKADWQFWGNVVSDAYKGAQVEIPAFGNIIMAVFSDIGTAIRIATADLVNFRNVMAVLDPFNLRGQIADYSNEVSSRVRGGAGGSVGSVIGPPASIPRASGGGRAPKDTSERDAQRAAEKAKREAEAAERERIEVLKKSYQEQVEYFEADAKRMLAIAKEYADAQGKTAEDLARYEETLAEGILQFKITKLKEYMNAVGAGTQEYADAQQKITILELDQERMRAEHAVNEQKRKKDAAEQAEKDHDKAVKRWNARIQALKDILEIEQKIDEQEAAAAKARAAEERQKRLQKTVGSGSEISAIQQLHDAFSNDQNATALAGLSALTDAFAGLGQAIGQVVQAWVLYGSAGTSVRKVTAQILASIAQQAAIKAIFELAEGFAALALAFFGVPNAGPSATAHFTAAAIYGGIAGIAAVAGRAVAGDEFKKEAGGAYGTAGQPRGQERNAQGQGQAYSGYGNNVTVIDQGRNAPNGIQTEVALVIKDRSNWFADMFEVELKKNGKVRQLVVNTATAA